MSTKCSVINIDNFRRQLVEFEVKFRGGASLEKVKKDAKEISQRLQESGKFGEESLHCFGSTQNRLSVSTPTIEEERLDESSNSSENYPYSTPQLRMDPNTEWLENSRHSNSSKKGKKRGKKSSSFSSKKRKSEGNSKKKRVKLSHLLEEGILREGQEVQYKGRTAHISKNGMIVYNETSHRTPSGWATHVCRELGGSTATRPNGWEAVMVDGRRISFFRKMYEQKYGLAPQDNKEEEEEEVGEQEGEDIKPITLSHQANVFGEFTGYEEVTFSADANFNLCFDDFHPDTITQEERSGNPLPFEHYLSNK